ncbi:MAG: hypothetical protein M1839_002831 [Geoglossum umbratile]|nr:MAG: hypothetical protein M1839_002831 [Geoglossum umbratile]
MGHPLDEDLVLAAQQAHRAAQRDLLPQPRQSPPRKPFAASAADFEPLRAVFRRTGGRNQSIDSSRATLPPSLRVGPPQDAKFANTGSALTSLRRTLGGFRRPGPRSPPMVGGDGADGAGKERGERPPVPKIWASYTTHPPSNLTSTESQSGNYDKGAVVTTSVIPVQNENPVVEQSGNITIALGIPSVAPKLMLSPDISHNIQATPDSEAFTDSVQSCTRNEADLEERLTAISQQLNGEMKENSRLVEEKGVLEDKNWRLHEENEELRAENADLRKENKTIKGANANGVPREEYERLKRQCANLVKENQQLRLGLKLEGEKELMGTFQTLCCEITNTCSRYSYGEAPEMRSETIRTIEDILQIRDKYSRGYLSMPDYRLALSTACLSQLLVQTIFHDPACDIVANPPKDLWADVTKARDMAGLERYMYSQVLNYEEYHRWRCMTVRFLSRTRGASEGYDRAEPVLQQFLKLHGGLFQLSKERFQDFEAELRSLVMDKAVDLSLCLRKQRSLIVVRTFGAFDEYHNSPDPRPCLVVRPELVRLTTAYGEGTEDSILVPMEKQHFPTLARSSSSAGRRGKGSFPFSKKSGKAKSSA